MITEQDRLAQLITQRRATDGYQTWGYHSRVSVAHRWVCVPIPKVACTTTKTVLREFDGLPPSEHIHDEGPRLADFTVADNVEMIMSPDWLRFAFVRNPYARLYSAYKSKIGNTWEQQYDWLRGEIREAFDYPARDSRRAGMVTFDDFVRLVAASDDPRIITDGHLAAQTAVLQQDCIRYDVIGRFESFQDDFTAILTRLGAPDDVRQRAREVLNPTPYSPLAAAYRRELADIVHTLYEADFEAWNYPRDSWLFIDL
ncbi:sulfotransferase family protein [Microlunatus soli]|nr:sulfotransferase family protein [Microlunatus soli]